MVRPNDHRKQSAVRRTAHPVSVRTNVFISARATAGTALCSAVANRLSRRRGTRVEYVSRGQHRDAGRRKPAQRVGCGSRYVPAASRCRPNASLSAHSQARCRDDRNDRALDSSPAPQTDKSPGELVGCAADRYVTRSVSSASTISVHSVSSVCRACDFPARPYQ
jgi:hypothetical protein